jgi:group I intron endonuclease
MSQGIIYLITNKVNGHKYVGQTTQPMNKRWSAHIQESIRMSNKPLHRAFRKYGVDKFVIKQIDECDISILNEREEYWIKHYNTFESAEGYNATSGGDRPSFSQETKDKLSNIMSDIERTDIWVNNIKNSLIEKAKKESWGFLKESNRGNGKHSALKIKGTNIETGEIKEWNSVSEAAIEVGGSVKKNGNILRAARKGYKCYGYTWEILEDKTKKKSIFGVNKKTKMIGPKYESIRQAAREVGDGGAGSGIIKSLRNPGKYSWKGYYWYYL